MKNNKVLFKLLFDFNNQIAKVLCLIILSATLTWSCERYLNTTPEIAVSDEDVFGNYENFQGYIDLLYSTIIQHVRHSLTTSFCIGGECISYQTWSSAKRGITGNYQEWVSNFDGFEALQSNLDCRVENKDLNRSNSGIWNDGWAGIRNSNLALSKFDLLTEATLEQKNWIKGQALFFRAYHHFEIIRCWGSMPFIHEQTVDSLIEGASLLPRYWDYNKDGITYSNFQAAAERIIEDLEEAEGLLPESWTTHIERATKGAATALKAKVNLYAGSPLMLKDAGKMYGTPEQPLFEQSYYEAAAQAAYDVIKMHERGVYRLLNWDEYLDNFARKDGSVVWSDEWIWGPYNAGQGYTVQTNRHGRLFTPKRFGGNAIVETPVQEYIDKFEMNDGTRYIPGLTENGGYDDDSTKRWENRDPRFRKSIYVDQDSAGYSKHTKLELHNEPGSDLDSQSVITPYIIHKYWPKGCNAYDKDWDFYTYNDPHIRLAEVYLWYAEAVYEITKNENLVPNWIEGATLTPLQAIDVLRDRIMNTSGGETFVNAATSLTNYPNFREFYRNEYAVELCFESEYWFNIRRWRIAHTLADKFHKLDFPKDYAYFNRVEVGQLVFEDPKHYWMPIPYDEAYIFEDFSQNPGW